IPEVRYIREPVFSTRKESRGHEGERLVLRAADCDRSGYFFAAVYDELVHNFPCLSVPPIYMKLPQEATKMGILHLCVRFGMGSGDLVTLLYYIVSLINRRNCNYGAHCTRGTHPGNALDLIRTTDRGDQERNARQACPND